MPAAGWIALVHSGSPYTYRHKHLQSGQNGFGFNVNRRTGPAYTWLYRETRYKQRLAVTLKSHGWIGVAMIQKVQTGVTRNGGR